MRQSKRIEYKAKLKLLRQFASGFDAKSGYKLNDIDALSFGQRSAIDKYYKVIAPLASRDFQVYKSRSKEKLREAQQFAQHAQLLPRIKVALIPRLYEGQELSLEFDNTKPKGARAYALDRKTGAAFFSIPLEPERLEDGDTEDYIAEQLEEYAPQAAEYFLVQCGEFQYYAQGADRGRIHSVVENLMMRYGSDKFDPNNANSHYFGNWLNGLRGYTDSYSAIDFAQSRVIKQRETYKAHRADQRKFGKKLPAIREDFQYSRKLFESQDYIAAQAKKAKRAAARKAAKKRNTRKSK